MLLVGPPRGYSRYHGAGGRIDERHTRHGLRTLVWRRERNLRSWRVWLESDIPAKWSVAGPTARLAAVVALRHRFPVGLAVSQTGDRDHGLTPSVAAR